MARTRTTALGILTLLASAQLLACGDGEKDNTLSSTGGNSSGHSSSAGGNTNPGSSNIAGNTAAGGTSPGDSSAAGGNSTGIAGASSGGRSGSDVGGSGAIVGGSSSLGGSAATGGASAVTCAASFISPVKNQKLANSSDQNGDCSDGIQYDVVVATTAPTGSVAVLSYTTAANVTTVVGTATVANAVAEFTGATLPSSGQITLSVKVADGACAASEVVLPNCAGAPTCSITTPTIDATTHPALNGVPVAKGGDMVSSVGAPYQAKFQVATDAGDGQTVTLTIDGSTIYPSKTSNGVATFPGITLVPDGQHTAEAACSSAAGVTGTSGVLSFPVDTAAPDLAPKKGKGAGAATVTALANGDHFDDVDDADPDTAGLQIRFCGATSPENADALDIIAGNPNRNNFCVAIGSNAPMCAQASANTGNGACVNLDCPGGGPFGVTLTLKDAAGNPTTVTRSSITCASSALNVQFVDPVSDSGSFGEISKRILSRNNTDSSALRKDISDLTGAQYNVVACTTAAAGSTATLSGGIQGQSKTQLGTTTVIADPNNTCQGNFPSVAVFSGVTLPESAVDATTALTAPTELEVSVVDDNLATGTATADVWVDSVDPTISLSAPSDFCGKFFNTAGTDSTAATSTLDFAATAPVTLAIANDGSPTPVTVVANASGGHAVFSDVALPAGVNTISAVAARKSGNAASYAPSPACSVTVGSVDAPQVVWDTPVATSVLGASSNNKTNVLADGNGSKSGWQGDLKACVPNVDQTKYPDLTLQFAVNGTNIGSPVAVDADTHCATLSGVDIPDGMQTALKATSSAVAGNVGTKTITIPVDTVAPTTPLGLVASVQNRRKTSFTLGWSAPSDQTAGVSNYLVKISPTAIANQSAFDAAESLTYSNTPAAPGEDESLLVDNRLIEHDYYFAVAAVDAVGNQGAMKVTTVPARAKFIQSNIKGVFPSARFGQVVDATGDFDNDGLSDLLVNYGNSSKVEIYFGRDIVKDVNGNMSSFPYTRISDTSGSPVVPLGTSIAAIGDVNGDGYEDLAIGATDAAHADGAVYIYYGRAAAAWTNLTLADADVKIVGDSTSAVGLGYSLTRLGDYNGDGVDDFAIGAGSSTNYNGPVVVVYGVKKTDGGLRTNISLPSGSPSGTSIISVPTGYDEGSFGWRILGLGRFFGGSTTPALVVAASFTGTNYDQGSLFAYDNGHTSPLFEMTGLAGEFLGYPNLVALGDVGPGGQAALGVSLTAPPTRVDAWSGSSSAGPFAVRASYKSSTQSDIFGWAFVGGGIPGRDGKFSFIGSDKADLAMSNSSGTPRVFIVDGTKVSMASASPTALAIDQSSADVTVDLATSFDAMCSATTGAPNLAGAGAIVVAECSKTNIDVDGHVVVLW